MFDPSYYISKSGVPILNKDYIDYIAERFLEDFCSEALRKPQAIDIDSFAMNYLKLKQDFQYLSHCGLYLGMMVFNDTKKVAVYNPDKNRAEYIEAREGTFIIDNSLLEKNQECRYRFTVGHEASHWIFHRLFFQRNTNLISSSFGE
jgi:Zn-dependent peptidase ImmA (M78 family)